MIERRELVVLLVLALAGTGIFGFFVTSSPTASVQLDQSQGEATTTAEAFLESRGYEVGSYRRSTIFAARSESATFIQRKLSGAAERQALADNNIYTWETRFYQPLEQETFRVAVDSSTGEVVEFTRSVADEADGGNLSQSDARDKATSFLRAQGHNLTEYERISGSTTERPNRIDHTFVWKHRTRTVADAPYYLEVTVQGDRIGSYDPHIKVPDNFTHQYQVQQNQGQVLSFGSLGLSLLIIVAALWFGLKYYKQESFDSRFALAVGGAVTVLSVVGAINSLPQIRHVVPTTFQPTLFLVVSVGGAAFGGLVLGGLATLTAGAGKELSREVLDMESVPGLATVRTDPARRAETARQLTAGVMLAGVILGIYAVVYLVGSRFFGFWLPSQPPQVGSVAMYLPALTALIVGGTAALWEEATYRLFAVPLTKRYLSYTALAVVLPAFVWGLGHSNYAVLPFWARAAEVTIIGIVLGVAFLRYGIVTTIAAHFTLNAFVTAVPMLLAGTGWLVTQGVIASLIALLPLFAAVGLLVYSGAESNGGC
jgi:hypothetical protein